MKTNKIFLLAAVVFLLALGIQAMRPEVSAEESKNTRLTMADDTATPTPGGMVVLGPEATPDPTPNGEVVIVPGVTPEPTPGGEIVPPDSTAVPEPTIDPETRPDPEAVSLGAVSLSIHPAEVVPLVVGGCVTGAGCEIRMSSSDLSVASVNEKGMVRGENPGTAVITVQVLWIGEAVKEMTCEVTVTSKKIPYKKLRKKLRAQRGSKMMFADEGSSASSLTLYDGLYWVFKVHPGDYTYGSGDETIFCYPKIVAKKEGDHATLRLGVELRSFVEIKDRVSRSFKSMKFSGGGKSFSVSGSTTCRYKTIGSYIRWQIRTQGMFYLSSDSNTHLLRLDTLGEILSVKKPKIIVKDTVHNRTYKCKITKDQAKNIKKLIKKYKKCLKAFW